MTLAWNLTPEETAYLAGLIDGEGCIAVRLGKDCESLSVVVTVSNTSQTMVDWLMALSPKPTVHTPKRDFAHRFKRCQNVCWSTVPALLVLKMTEPYLTAKKKQAHLVLAWRETEQAVLLGTRMTRFHRWNRIPETLKIRRRELTTEMRFLRKTA